MVHTSDGARETASERVVGSPVVDDDFIKDDGVNVAEERTISGHLGRKSDVVRLNS